MEMNKEYEYKGYKFNIKVEFNVRGERHIGGKRWHKVSINDMGAGNWGFVIPEVLDGDLIRAVNNIQAQAEAHVDGNVLSGLTPVQEALLGMGFKK